MATLRCLQEVEMMHLSEGISHTSYSKLCNALGYSYDWYQSILANHRDNYNEAMTEILIKWNTQQTDTSRSRSILARKLHNVELGGLGIKLSKGEYLPSQQEPHEQETTPLQSIPGEYLPSQQGSHGQEATPLLSSSGIYSKKISKSLTVQRCREKLENKYLNQLCKISMKPWDKSCYAEFKDMHTVVTMVKKDARRQDTKNKEILQGSVGEIFSTKVNDILPSRILISAPAGRGKTTAVAKMAYDWVHREKGSALEHLPLLFVVKFRDTSQRTSIGEAIKSQLLSDVDDLTPEGLENFIRENQGICHILLDGLDEYGGISSSNRSSGSNMVSVIRWEEFPECRVLVTTRPHLENFFNKDDLSTVYTKMWIEGFSQESSREYINKFFASTSSPDSGRDLKVYLDNQPLINELAKTPLFCLMVCHLWSDGSLNTETATQTELLDSVNVFLMHHANARSKSKGTQITDENLGEIIRKLGKVALAGLLDDSKKLVFTPHDFRRVPSILDMACELGILFKMTVTKKMFPRSHETTSITIEFYHKLVQEHSAGKYLAYKATSRKRQWPWQKSYLDRTLLKINANIGDYENLIRFAAGTDNRVCIQIMEALLSNSFLDESERYRILLDCSSETRGTEGNISSLIQRCMNAQSIVLKSPTVYTVAGMQNLPKQLKREVRTLTFEGSTLSIDVTSGLWSCLRSFTSLNQLTISDSSLSFPPSPPGLRSVTKLSAEKLTSQSYEGLLSSIPGVRDIDVSIDVAETSNTFQTTNAFSHISQTRARDEQSYVHIRLHAWPAPTTDRKMESGETIGGLSLLIEDQTKDQQRLHVSGEKDIDEEALVDLFAKTKELTYLNSESEGCFLLNKENAVQNTRLEIEHCHLCTEVTEKLWTSLGSLTSLKQLTISDSSLNFPSSPPELPSVTKLSAKKVTSQSYEGVLSSIPGVRDIDVSIEDAKTSNTFQITTTSRSTRQARASDEQFFVHIRLHAWPALTTDRKIESGETFGGLSLLIEDQTKYQQRLHVSGVKDIDEEALVDLFVKTKQRTYLNSRSGGGSLNKKNAVQNTRLEIEQCNLSTEMTKKLWTSLRSFTSLNHLIISDSSLSFPPSPPELPSVTKLSAERVTSQSYEGLLSSIPGVRDIDVSIDVAETSNTFQITTTSRPIRQTRARDEQFSVHIRLHAWPAPTTDRKIESGETIGGLSLIFEDQTKIPQRLDVSGVKGRDEEALVDLFVKTKQLTYLNSGSGCGSLDKKNTVQNASLEIEHCHLSTGMTQKLCSSLRSFTPLNHLTISDSSLSLHSSPPEQLSSVTKLSAQRVTSQSYEGLLSSLPGLRDIDITIDDGERDIRQITAGLRRTGRQQLTHIKFKAPLELPSENKNVSRKTMRGLGLLIKEQTKNLRYLHLAGVNCLYEEDLVDLIECCRLVKTMSYVWLCNQGKSFLGQSTTKLR